MKKCVHSKTLNQETVSEKVRCYPTTDTYRGSDYCMKHLILQEQHAEKTGRPMPKTTEDA